MRARPIDLDALLAAWPAPAPPTGFADRVLRACEPPAKKRFAVGRALLVAAAVLAVGAPLYFVHHAPAAAPPALAATDPDLGISRD